MSDQKPGSRIARLDLRGVACPLTFVRTRLALNRLSPGEPLEVLLDQGEPAESVPRSCTEDGELVLELGPWSEPGVVRLLVARGETAA
ncbi:MAG: sulfurtransferase TusA family protein [Candidatus Dormiibacterota bacterium]